MCPQTKQETLKEKKELKKVNTEKLILKKDGTKLVCNENLAEERIVP